MFTFAFLIPVFSISPPSISSSCHFLYHHFGFLRHLGFTGKTILKEKWYGTEYNIAPFDSVTQTERWTRCLQGDSEYKDRVSLPLMNPFVPTDFTIRNTAPSTPAAAVAVTVGGAENIVGAAVVMRPKPDLLEYVTTVTIESEDADAHDIDMVNDAASALSITEAAVSVSEPATNDAAEDGVVVKKDDDKEVEGEGEDEDEDEDEGCEEDDEQDVPVGSLPPLQGKVIHLSSFLRSNSTTYRQLHLYSRQQFI